LHGANRLGGNSLSDLLVFGKRAGEHAAAFARDHGAVRVNDAAADDGARRALEPFERQGGEGPYQIQQALQHTMQDLVGIVRREDDMRQALGRIADLRARAQRVTVEGNREYNPGWHTALDLGNLLTIAEAIARSAIERKESRGGHFRDDYPAKDASYSTFNIVIRQGADGSMQLTREPIAPMPDELRTVIAEMG
jgi:succinate dehydrogenase / fumarate reductase flavoprotein subunit